MKTTLRATLALLLLVSTIPAQSLRKSDFLTPKPLAATTGLFRPMGPMAISSTVVCTLGQSLDIISSTGYEGNAFLRDSNGKMNRARAIPLKLAPCLLPLLFERKLNRTARIAVHVAQFALGAAALYDAGHNFKVNH